jgi:putative transposase
MPDHFHILITPSIALERAVQFIKGGFSFRAKKELESNLEIWQLGFSDHRVRDLGDYQNHVGYIHRNPVGRKLVECANEYLYCSAFPGAEKDEVPQWLKPHGEQASGAAEAAPLHDSAQPSGGPEGSPLQNATEAAPVQNAPEAASLQNHELELISRN